MVTSEIAVIADDAGGREGADAALQNALRFGRRLSDKILVAFHQACDQADLEVADQLLRALETLVTRRPLLPQANRRRMMETLVAAHERLWHLRHPEAESQ